MNNAQAGQLAHIVKHYRSTSKTELSDKDLLNLAVEQDSRIQAVRLILEPLCDEPHPVGEIACTARQVLEDIQAVHGILVFELDKVNA